MAYLGANANQSVELRSTRFRFTATEGQTTFSGNDANGVSLTAIDSSSHVFLNGARLSPDGDFTTTGTNIVLSVAAFLNDILEVHEVTQVHVTDVGGAAKRSGDIFTGGVTAPTITLNDASQPTGSQAVKYSNAPWLGSNSIIRTNANNIAENITVDSATNGMSAGPIQIDSGFTVTVNGEWSIV
tara:strand:- start:58 stop:612 length:555 start_codon:yes stop_codon:yes gene_type:complete